MGDNEDPGGGESGQITVSLVIERLTTDDANRQDRGPAAGALISTGLTVHSWLQSCASPDCSVCEAYRLKQRVNQLAKCVRIQRQALLNIHETATDADIVRLASQALQEAQW